LTRGEQGQKLFDEQASPASIVGRLPPWQDLLILGLILALSFGLRWPFRDVSLIRDEGEYAYAGQQILQGAVPYRDIYNQKTPFAFYWMALVQWLAGPELPALRVATTLYGLITTVAMYLLARRLFGSPAGLVAALAFTLMTFDQCGITHSASTEFFMLLWMVVALFFWYRGRQDHRAWPLVLAGVAAGVAYQTKQSGVLLLAFFALDGILSAVRYRPRLSGYRLSRQAALVVLGFAVGLGLTLACFAWQGALREYVECTWTRNWQYVGRRHRGWMHFITLGRQVLNEVPGPDRGFWIWGSAGLVGLAISPLVHPFFRKSSRTQLTRSGSAGETIDGRDLWILQVLCTGFALLGGVPFIHYWEPLIVPLSLGNVAAARWLFRLAARSDFSLVVRGGLALVLVAPWFPPLLNGAALLNMPESQKMKRKELAVLFGARQAAQYLAEHTSPDESILIIGSEPEIYYYANRRACTRLVFVYPMTGEYSYAAQLREEFEKDLIIQHPRYVLFVNNGASLMEDPEQRPVLVPILNELRKNYRLERQITSGPENPSLDVLRRLDS
jgi:4-amino-4-deoxy-L-arabinose transferase-like glycosyltransferase